MGTIILSMAVLFVDTTANKNVLFAPLGDVSFVLVAM